MSETKTPMEVKIQGDNIETVHKNKFLTTDEQLSWKFKFKTVLKYLFIVQNVFEQPCGGLSANL